METKLINLETDYEILKVWWAKHRWPCVAPRCLPEIGYMVWEKDVPCAAAFLYKTDSKICWMEWLVGNPDIYWARRAVAIGELITAINAKAKELGYEFIFSACMEDHTRYWHKLVGDGFMITDKKVMHFMKEVR